MAEQVDRPIGHLLKERDEIGDQLVDGVVGQLPGLGGQTVTALIQRYDLPGRRERLHLQREVIGRPGVAMQEHQRCPGGLSVSIPIQFNIIDALTRHLNGRAACRGRRIRRSRSHQHQARKPGTPGLGEP